MQTLKLYEELPTQERLPAASRAGQLTQAGSLSLCYGDFVGSFATLVGSVWAWDMAQPFT